MLGSTLSWRPWERSVTSMCWTVTFLDKQAPQKVNCVEATEGRQEVTIKEEGGPLYPVGHDQGSGVTQR